MAEEERYELDDEEFAQDFDEEFDEDMNDEADDDLLEFERQLEADAGLEAVRDGLDDAELGEGFEEESF